MSVRIREAGQPPQSPRRRVWWIVAVAVVVVVAAGVVTVLLGGDDTSGEDASPPGDSTQTPVSDQDLPLEVGDATAALDGASRDVGSGQRGFPHTTAGAVEAATALHVRMVRGPLLPNSENRAFVQDALPGVSLKSGMDTLQSSREAIGADENGVVADLAPGQRYYADCLPQYGAYATADGPEDGVVDVYMWMPCLYGPGAPGDVEDLRVDWQPSFAEIEWSDGDWRAWEGQYGDVPSSWGSPAPADPNRPNVSFDERAQLLTGDWKLADVPWKLYEGASDTWPTDLLGPAPEDLQ